MSEAQAGVQWVKCPGCNGEVGIPRELASTAVACPKCGAPVNPVNSVLYRPPSDASPAVAARASPSLKLNSEADSAIIYGVLSVLLGWTVIVPILGLVAYWDASERAEKEKVPVPTKATVGLILSLGFGILQSIAFLPRLYEYVSKWH